MSALLFSWAGGWWASVWAAQPAPSDLVSRKLRESLMESEPRLGALEPWQKRLFDEEVLPQALRFIRDYRRAQTHSGTAVSSLSVDIDMEALKDYLRFYGPKALGSGTSEPALLVYTVMDTGCGAKCVTAGPALRKLIALRATRRGFKPVWLAAEDLGTEGTELKGKGLRDKLEQLAQKRGAGGVFLVEWGRAPVDESDSAHADEVHYQLLTNLMIRGFSGGGAPYRNEGRLEVLQNDSFEMAFNQLATDAFTELGAKIGKLQKSGGGASEGDAEEVLVRLNGVRDFAQLSAVKASLQAKFASASVYERKVARAGVTLVVSGEKSQDSVRKAIAEILKEAKASKASLPQMEIEE